MKTPDQQYKNLVKYILDNGEKVPTPQDIDALTCFGTAPTLVYDFENGVPVIGERKMGVKDTTLWIIGGGEIYKNFIDLADELHITHVEGDFPADTFFPKIPARDFKKFSEERVEGDERNSHHSIYTVYKRA